MTRQIIGMLAGIALCLQATQALAESTLSITQLKRLFPGTFVGVYNKDKNFFLTANASGFVRAVVDKKHDQGAWIIKRNKLCITWQHWARGKQKCRYIARRGKWYVALKSNGKSKIRFRRK